MAASRVYPSPVKAGRPDREAQRLATREKLLEVCVAEFRRRGYANTDVAAIVKAAGVSRGSFYFHFPTKGDVLAELRLREELRIFTDVSPLLAGAAPLEAILRAVVAGILQAEERLGSDILREMCAAQFHPEIADADSFDEHPVAQLIFATVQRSWHGPQSGQAIQQIGDLAFLFLIGMFGLLSTSTGPSAERDRRIASLISLTTKGLPNP